MLFKVSYTHTTPIYIPLVLMFGENTRFYDLSLKNCVSNKQKWACTNSLLDLWGLGDWITDERFLDCGEIIVAYDISRHLLQNLWLILLRLMVNLQISFNLELASIQICSCSWGNKGGGGRVGWFLFTRTYPTDQALAAAVSSRLLGINGSTQQGYSCMKNY